MQWHAVLGVALGGSRWAGVSPPIGEMDVQTLDVLCRILAVHTADPMRCFFGLCTLEDWLDSFAADELQALLELPCGRDYIVLEGPLPAVDQIAYDWSGASSSRLTLAADEVGGLLPEPDSSELLRRRAPNLIWPADHAWLAVSEVDFDSTLVGGSAELIQEIVESTELEAWQVEPTDSLAADADKINVGEGGRQ